MQPEKWTASLIQIWLTDPRIGTTQIVRFDRSNQVRFLEVERIAEVGLTVNRPMVEIVASYGIDSYRFSQTFL